MSTASIEVTHPATYFPAPNLGSFQDFKMSPADKIVFEPLPVPLPLDEPDISLCIDIPAFQLQLAIPITAVESDMKSGHVAFRSVIENDAILILTGTGKLSEKEDSFKIEYVNLHMDRLTKTARADFIVSTIRAALILGDAIHVRIPSIQFDITLRFDEPLLDISQMLRRRQINYRLMVIEKAIGTKFQVPPDISGEQVGNIALIYYAITERSFEWPISEIGYGLQATKDILKRLQFLNQLSSIKIGPHLITETLFSQPIFLGYGYITVEDKIIENFDEVQKELAREDGRLVNLVIRSSSGHGRYDLPDAPRLPDEAWDKKIQRLIELEDSLDMALVARYHALAASTLEGLTEEEKAAITARPELDENAFLE
ncbi:MAG: hypothetical protein ACJ74W_20760 [Pyrinomonadaceae bacterium]